MSGPPTDVPPLLEYESHSNPIALQRRNLAGATLRTSGVYVFLGGLFFGSVAMLAAANYLRLGGSTPLSILNFTFAAIVLLFPVCVGIGSVLYAPKVDEDKNASTTPAIVLLALQLIAFLGAVAWDIRILASHFTVFGLGICLLILFQSHSVIRALLLLRNPHANTITFSPPAQHTPFWLYEFDNLETRLQRHKPRFSWRCADIKRTLIAAFLLFCSILIITLALPTSLPVDPCTGSTIFLFSILALLCLRNLWRGGCTIDLPNRLLLRWHGFGIRLFTTSIPFTEIQSLHLARGKRPGNRSQNWCNLHLTLSSSKKILLRRFDYKPEAHRVGILFASIFGRDLQDAT